MTAPNYKPIYARERALCDVWAEHREEGPNVRYQLKIKTSLRGAESKSGINDDVKQEFGVDYPVRVYRLVESCICRLYDSRRNHAVTAFLHERLWWQREPCELQGPLWDERRTILGNVVGAMEKIYEELAR